MEVYIPDSREKTLKDDHLGYKQTHHHLLLHKSDAYVKDSLPNTEVHKTNDRNILYKQLMSRSISITLSQ